MNPRNVSISGWDGPLDGALWIVRLNQIKQCFLRHHRLNIAEKSLAPSAFLDVGLFVITEYELLAAFHTIP